MPSTAPDMNTPGMPKTKSSFVDEPSLIDAMALAIASYYESLGENASKLFICEDEGKTFGWKINSHGIRLVECGCYTEAVWPAVLSLGLGPIVKNIGQSVAPKIVKKLNQKLMKKYVKAIEKTLKEILDEINKSIAIAVLRVSRRAVQQNRLTKLIFGDRHIDVLDLWSDLVDHHLSIIRNIMESMTDEQSIFQYLDSRIDLPDSMKLGIHNLEGRTITSVEAIRGHIKDLEEELLALYNKYTIIRTGPQPGFPNGIPNVPLDPEIKQFVDNFSMNEESDLVSALRRFLINNDQTFLEDSAFDTIISRASGLAFFAFGVLSYCTVVIDKECSPLIIDETFKSEYNGPTDHSIPLDIQSRLVQIVDAVYFQGKWKGGSWDGSVFYPIVKNNNCRIDSSIGAILGNNPSWSDIQRVLVEKRLPVWPEMTTNCECSQCPSGYQLCSYSSIINGWSDVYNICLPACGGQSVQPVRVANVVIKANCDIRCPDGYMWVNCAHSDCDKSTCQDGSDLGYCVKIPDELVSLINNDIDIKYGKIAWDPVECRWFCLNGTWIMDWTSNDGSESIGPVYSDDPRFNEKVYVSPAGPGGVGNYIQKYKFRADRFERYPEECVEPLIRDPENNCECSGAYNDIGIPEVPEGYILFDNNVIPIVDEDDPSSEDSGDDDTPDPSGDPCVELYEDDVIHSFTTCSDCMKCSDDQDSEPEDLPYKICPKPQTQPESENCEKYDYSDFTGKILPYDDIAKYDQNSTSSCGSVSLLTQLNQHINKYIDDNTSMQIDIKCLFGYIVKFLEEDIVIENVQKYIIELIDGSGRSLDPQYIDIYASFDPSSGTYNKIQTRNRALHPILVNFDPNLNNQTITVSSSSFYFSDTKREIGPPIFTPMDTEDSNAWRKSNNSITFRITKVDSNTILSKKLIEYLLPLGLKSIDANSDNNKIDCRTFSSGFNDVILTLFDSGAPLKLYFSPITHQDIFPFNKDDYLDSDCDGKKCFTVTKRYNSDPDQQWPIESGIIVDTDCPAEHIISVVAKSLNQNDLVTIAVKKDFLQQLHLYQLGLNQDEVKQFSKEYDTYEKREERRRQLMLQYERRYPLSSFPENAPPGGFPPKEDIQHWSWDADWLGPKNYFRPIPTDFQLGPDPSSKDTCKVAESGPRHWMTIYGMEIFNSGAKSEYIKFYVKNSFGEPFDKMSFIIMTKNITPTWPFYGMTHYPDNDNDYIIKECD